LAGESHEKRPFGRLRRSLKDNIKIDIVKVIKKKETQGQDPLVGFCNDDELMR
jgi:hypothetical protein